MLNILHERKIWENMISIFNRTFRPRRAFKNYKNPRLLNFIIKENSIMSKLLDKKLKSCFLP